VLVILQGSLVYLRRAIECGHYVILSISFVVERVLHEHTVVEEEVTCSKIARSP
jgi:hypothetical protein